MKKKKTPLTNDQAIFVLKGMLATIKRIEEDCNLADGRQSFGVIKARAGIHGLILALRPVQEDSP